MTTADLSEPIGQAFLGRYRLVKKIAVGGMAELYLARVSGAGGFEKNVVVKRILPQLADSDELFRMFLDEARIAATLQHPNVIQTYDACDEDGEYFIAMEYLDGTDLRTLRKVLADKVMPLPWEHALYILVGVAAGLHYAHEKTDLDGQPLGIVHRDVSPQNVFLTREGGVKLVDFGIAVAQNRLTETANGTLKGKLAYMSPEQCRSDRLDRRSDIYSLGILLYELTTGRRLYTSSGDYDLLKQIVEEEIEPPSSFMEFPEELEEIILRCLAKDPEDRFQTARDVQRALEEFASAYHLMISSLAFSTFLEPLLDEASQQMRMLRQRHREPKLRRRIAAGSMPPPVEDSPAEVAEAGRVTEFDPELDLDLDTDPGHEVIFPPSTEENPPQADASLHDDAEESDGAEPAQQPTADSDSDGQAIPELIGDADQRTVRVSSKLIDDLTSKEKAVYAQSAGHEIKPRTRAKSSPSRVQVTPKPERAQVAPAQTARHARRSSTIELHDGDVDILDVKIRRRGAAVLWIIAIVLCLGAGGWYLANMERGTRPTADPTPTAKGDTGTIVVSGKANATVWLNLGRTPVDVFAITEVDSYRVRIEHDGFAPRNLDLDQRYWRRSDSGRLEVSAHVELLPANSGLGAAAKPTLDRDRSADHGAAEKESTQGFDPLTRPSRLRIESTPKGSAVWLMLGTTPNVRVGNRSTSESHELRIERPGQPPAYLVVRDKDFDAGGEARVDIVSATPSAGTPAESPRQTVSTSKASADQ